MQTRGEFHQPPKPHDHDLGHISAQVTANATDESSSLRACGQKKQLKAPISLTVSGDRPFFCVLIPDSTITPGQWSVMWPNCEQLGVVKPDRVSGCDGSPPAARLCAASSCAAARVSQKPDHADVFCLLCSFLFPRCISIPGGSYRRRCAKPQTLTAALFRRRVAERERRRTLWSA